MTGFTAEGQQAYRLLDWANGDLGSRLAEAVRKVDAIALGLMDRGGAYAARALSEVQDAGTVLARLEGTLDTAPPASAPQLLTGLDEAITAAAAIVGGQLDLAGWDTAWLTEHRGRGGEWVKNLPGGYRQPTFPGMPRGTPPAAWEAADHQLETDMAAGIRSETSPKAKAKAGMKGYFGNSAQTSVVTFSNGHKWVRKNNLDDDEVHTEVLAARVSDAVEAGAPPVVTRADPDAGGLAMWEPFLKGAKTAIEWEGGQNEDGEPLNEEHDPYELYGSPGGVRIGILDNLIHNQDRHEGNWMVKHNRKTGEDSPLPIDHGHVTFEDDGGYGTGPFGENLMSEPDLLGGIPEEEWAAMRRKLEALQDDFGQLGRGDAWESMMGNFAAMEQAAADSRTESA